MDIDIDVKDIDGTHQIGAQTEKIRRPITVEFAKYSEKRKIFGSKKKLKSKNLSITESLTKLRIIRFRATRDEYGFRNVSIFDGKIL